MNNDYYVDLILPFSFRGLFTYRVPEELIVDCQVGKRVVVQLAKKKYIRQ